MQLANSHLNKTGNTISFNDISDSGPITVEQTYQLMFHPTLKHSNATQNVYFSNYIEWQGMVRERWFFECIDSQMLQHKGVFVTRRVHQEFFKEAFPFQEITCRMNTFDIQKCSFCLLFRFYSSGQLIASGYQKIAFTSHNKKIVRLPEEVIEKIRLYSVEESEYI